MIKAIINGTEYFTNHQGEGVFTRNVDGTWQQHVGTIKSFSTVAAFRAYVRRRFTY